MTTLRKAIVRLAALGTLVALATCSHDIIVDPPPPPDQDGATVSDPVHGPTFGSATSIQRNVVTAASAVEPSDVVYVSLPTGTLPNGELATVRNTRTGNTAIVHVSDGGFDPVPMSGRAGDAVELSVIDRANAPVYMSTLYVPVRRPPRIVHSIPSKGKTDSPLNTHVIVVFSEPVDGSSVNASSIRLLRGSTSVAGTVKFLDPSMDANQLSVVFVPDKPLLAHTQYELQVTTEVRDLSGDAMEAGVKVPFATGESATGAPASIRVVPDSMLQLVVGDSYQLTATVLDAAGNALTDQPVTWSAGRGPDYRDPCNLAVSTAGLLTTVAEEGCRITASVADVSKGLSVIVGPKPSSVTLSPTPAALAAGDTIFLSAIVRDAAGNVVPFGLTWASSDPSVATVQAYSDVHGSFGLVTGVAPGNVTITATTAGAGASSSGTAAITVGPARPVASVRMSPSSMSLVVQGKAQLSATLFDANGKLIYNRPISWASSNLGTASVDANGVLCPTNCVAVRGAGLGSAQVTATSGGVSGTTSIAVIALKYASVSAGFARTCGLTLGGTAWCWGMDPLGLDRAQFGSATLVPAPLPGGLTFSSIGVGFMHACGLTTDGAAYCWGSNEEGELGTGSSGPSDVNTFETPAAVKGGLVFTRLSVGTYHSCGLTAAGAAYCWGRNQDGELGIGTTTGPELCPEGGVNVPCSTTPVRVTGGLAFASLSAGAMRTCGLTASGAAYCWGRGQQSSLGDGTNSSSANPVPVSGSLAFSAVSAGASGTICGVTTSGAGYCWGGGPLGDGTLNSSRVPVAVAGGLTFTSLSPGSGMTCGIATGGAVYCWGFGALGPQPGDLVPAPVSGGLVFSTVSAGSGHYEGGFACGVTTDGTAYCWGQNADGQLGTGTTTDSKVPIKVAGQP